MELKRSSVIALHLAGKSQAAIVGELTHMKVDKYFVHRTIKRYNESGSTAKRYGGGRRRTATTPQMINKAKACIQQNPSLSGNKLAKQLGISLERTQHILKNHLGLKFCRLSKSDDPSGKNTGISKKGNNPPIEETTITIETSVSKTDQSTHVKHLNEENTHEEQISNVLNVE